MHAIVLSIDLPARSALRTMRVLGNPRGAHPGYVVEARKQAAARLSRAVIVLPVAFADRPDRATLGCCRRQATSTQKAGAEGTVGIRDRGR
jgi:hypothetical protein